MKQANFYNEMVRYYNRSRRKLQSLAVEGKNQRKQHILQKRIIRLFKTLTGLQRALKLGMTTAALSAGMLLFQPNAALAQTITFQGAGENPFGLTGLVVYSFFGAYATPTFADLDGDGDMDLMAGHVNGNFYYFQNTGIAAVPAFAAPLTNPLGIVNMGYDSAPAFADLDGDGDMDMISGDLYGGFFYFKNTGTATAPAFAAAQINPFGLTGIGTSQSAPAFADLDGDGDLDIMSGANTGVFYYFENTGSATAPAFAAVQFNPFGLTDTDNSWSKPAFADLDEDGDLDMIAGDLYGDYIYFQNTGTATAPAFAPYQVNPFGLSNRNYGCAPAFTDLDADGDMDIMQGGNYGDFFYFENTTSCFGLTVYADADGDGYGDIANSLFVADCIVPDGYVNDSTDCDDANANVHPNATEACNGIDDNCNGLIDDNCGETCASPTNLTTSNITASSAELNWNAVAGVDSYKVRYKISGIGEWTKKNTSSNSEAIDGLSSDTKYTWQVRSLCEDSPNGNVSSDWSAKQTFTTASSDGLIAYYPFNGNAHDETGNGYDGTVVGATLSDDRFGNPKSAYSFDGSDDEILIGPEPNFPSWDTYSVSLWFLNDGGGDQGRGYGQKILSKAEYFSDFHLSVGNDDANGNLSWWCAQGGFNSVNATDQDYRDNVWHHVVLNKNSPSEGDLWIDGVLQASSNDLQVVVNGDDLVIGFTTHTDPFQQKHFSGKIDDIRFYNRVLSESEILELFMEGGTVCAVPSNLSVTNISSSAATVNWDATDGAKYYRIGYKANGSGEWISAHDPVTGNKIYTTSFTFTDLAPNTTYKWRVASRCDELVPESGVKGPEFTTPSEGGGEKNAMALLNSELGIYPNVTTGKFMLELRLPEKVSDATVQVMSILGQTVFSEKAEATNGKLQKEIQLHQAVPGIYLVRVIAGDRILSKKIEVVQ